MNELLNKSKVLVVMGSGGVGKTTLAACLGVQAAHLGKQVLVLTIDPSKRLKTTLRLSDSGDIERVVLRDPKAQLFAGVVNPQRVFDEFIRRSGAPAEIINKIISNKLYVQLSGSLSGSQEFTSLVKLHAEVTSGKYDLVILDTPPAKHAIDFLNAPQKLSQLFNEGVAKWFRSPRTGGQIFTQVLNFGTRQVLRALETLTGSDFIKELSEFFIYIQAWQQKIEDRIAAVHQILVNADTSFVLVSSLNRAKLQETIQTSKEIRQGGFHLTDVMINRGMPLWMTLSPGNKDISSRVNLAIQDQNLHEQIQSLRQTMQTFYFEREQMVQGYMKELGSGSGVANSSKINLTFVPELNYDVSDLSGLEELSQIMIGKKAK